MNAFELVLLKQYLIHGLFDGGEIEARLRHDDVGLGKRQVEHVLTEQVVPHLTLHVPVDEVALVMRETEFDVKNEGLIIIRGDVMVDWWWRMALVNMVVDWWCRQGTPRHKEKRLYNKSAADFNVA